MILTSAMPRRDMVEIGGESYGMDYDMMTLAEAERAYAARFSERLNAQQIISEMIRGHVAAVMAFAFGALRSAGTRLTFDAFAKDIFGRMPLDWWVETLADGVVSMFGEPEQDAGECGSKN